MQMGGARKGLRAFKALKASGIRRAWLIVAPGLIAGAAACGDSSSAPSSDGGNPSAATVTNSGQDMGAESLPDEQSDSALPSSSAAQDLADASTSISEPEVEAGAADGPATSIELSEASESASTSDSDAGGTDPLDPDEPSSEADNADQDQTSTTGIPDGPPSLSDAGSPQTVEDTEIPAVGEDDGGSEPVPSIEWPVVSLPEPVADLEPTPEFEGIPGKVDMLFVVDNSRSMADKQRLLGDSLPELVERLIDPHCVDDEGNREAANDGQCSLGFEREFAPVSDLHLAVITTSLGGYGAQVDCGGLDADVTNPGADMARLLGALPRGQAAAPNAAETGFLGWTSGAGSEQLVADFKALVDSAGEFGCGWEAPLESWVRFLVDPLPYRRVVRLPCNSNDAAVSCAGPELNAEGELLVDTLILQQRASFLRPDSLLSVVMFTDENDCSFKPSGQSWRLAQSAAQNNVGTSYYPAFKGTAACMDPAYGPNHDCCHSCGQATVPDLCPTALDAQGTAVAVGCEQGRKFTIDDARDHPNLRCFHQKERFGVDYLLPLERYTNALTSEYVCWGSDTLDAESCSNGVRYKNPLFQAKDGQRRPFGWIYLVGILGVPWQDIAVDPMGEEPLRYLGNDPEAPESERINWDWVLGADGVADDPLMREQVSPRSGTNPATGNALGPAGSGYLANPINGHEWNILDESELQYACIFPIQPVECPSREEVADLEANGQELPVCECTDYPGEEWGNPTCQAPDGSFGATQYHGKAYPGLRELSVLRELGKNAVVASICAKSIDPVEPDYGYGPAIDAMLDRFAETLAASGD